MITADIIRVINAVAFRFKRLKHSQGKHFCPCCQSRVIKFNNWEHVQGETCVFCGSARRHRLLHLFLSQYAPHIFEGRKRLLHIAPEIYMKRLFQRNPYLEYVSADMSMKHVMLKMDVTDIPFPDNTFDYIVCNHVLEHVMEDRKAMKELCRVLDSHGFAVLQVPVYEHATFEDPSVVDPQERKRLFGLEDHVRKYGPDYKDRLEESGFIVHTFTADELYTYDQIDYHGLWRDESIYICCKSRKGLNNISIEGTGTYH